MLSVLASKLKKSSSSSSSSSESEQRPVEKTENVADKPEQNGVVAESSSNSSSSAAEDNTPEEKSASPEKSVSPKRARGDPRRRRPIPMKYRGKIGQARLNVSTPLCSFKKTSVFNAFKKILREDMGRADVKITQEAYRMLAVSLERQLLDNAVIANRLALANNVITVEAAHAKLSAHVLGKPGSNWGSADSAACDALQFGKRKSQS